MLVIVGNTMLHLHHWAETCPCHESHKLALKHGFIANLPTCPLLGRRAPEICCGDLEAMLETLYDTPLAQLASECFSQDRAGADEWNKIVADFQTIRLLFVQTIRLKTLPMRTLPRVLIGMAHHDVVKARQACGRALRRHWEYMCVYNLYRPPTFETVGFCRV